MFHPYDQTPSKQGTSPLIRTMPKQLANIQQTSLEFKLHSSQIENGKLKTELEALQIDKQVNYLFKL